MGFSLEEKYALIREEILKSTLTNPIEILINVMRKDFVNIHGPEHHFLDGASFLAAYKNSGGSIDLNKALDILEERSVKMPGAMCGYWGVCGSVTSIGASLSIIHNTGPLSNDNFYQDHMKYSSLVMDKMAIIGGPRCCKRNAFISIINAVEFVKETYHIDMDASNVLCEFSDLNKQCIKEKCQFHKNR